jgi:acyl carrier protein
MSMDKVMQFKTLVAQYSDVKVEDMTDDMRFREDLGMSSMSFMSFLGEIEDTFDVELDQEAALKVQTIGDALKMMESISEE